MATIITKNSSTASSVPLAAQLVQGELAVNVTDKRLFTENSGGTVVELGTNPSTLVVASGASIQGLTVGRGAGSVATNTAVGASALSGSNTGGYNTAVGYLAMAANTTGELNVAVGRVALDANTTGNNNTALGDAALTDNTTGGSNVAVGRQALTANTTASNNVAVGYLALQANTTASYNTAVGYQAAYGNTTGAYNASFGQAAFNSNTTGNYNTALGTQSLASNTTANDNTAVGYQAAYSNTTGTQNAAVGKEALKANTTGFYNNAVGAFALAANTTGNTNNAMGRLALYANTTGSSNTDIGQEALQANTTASNNTILGYQAGLNTTSSNNTFVGYGAGYLVNTGAKNTIIGAYGGNQGGLDIRTASNYIVLSDGDGNPRGIFDSSGNLLVGTTDSSKGALTVGKAAPNAAYGQICALSPTAGDSATSGMSVVKYANDSTTAQVLMRFLINQGGAGQGQINANGANTAAFGSYSDSRLKENIVDLPSQLDSIMALRPVEYDYIESMGGGHQIGFVAQEVQAIYPDLVGEDAEGMLTLTDMNKNDARLIKCIQEQQALITALTARITALEAA